MVSFLLGKRTADNARRFLMDVSSRMALPTPHASDDHAFTEGTYKPVIQISTDAFAGYPEAVDLAFGLVDRFSLGLASRLGTPAKNALRLLPLRVSIDPALFYVSTANAISNGSAARSLCISKEQLEKLFLLQHFKQHYQAVIGSLLTWRQIPNWLDERNLPSWVISGLSS